MEDGGGVLITVNNDLSIQSKIIPVKCAAELLAVELTLGDGSKIILTACHRVGTLGQSNCNEMLQTIKKKMFLKFVVIGDFNLKAKGVNWVIRKSKNRIENEFLKGFSDLGLLQCINVPTHNKGSIFDILLPKFKLPKFKKS